MVSPSETLGPLRHRCLIRGCCRDITLVDAEEQHYIAQLADNFLYRILLQTMYYTKRRVAVCFWTARKIAASTAGLWSTNGNLQTVPIVAVQTEGIGLALIPAV